MEKNERHWQWLRICAWAIMVLGTVHEVAAGIIYPAVARQLKTGGQGSVLYVFLGTGAGLFFCRLGIKAFDQRITHVGTLGPNHWRLGVRGLSQDWAPAVWWLWRIILLRTLD